MASLKHEAFHRRRPCISRRDNVSKNLTYVIHICCYLIFCGNTASKILRVEGGGDEDGARGRNK